MNTELKQSILHLLPITVATSGIFHEAENQHIIFKFIICVIASYMTIQRLRKSGRIDRKSFLFSIIAVSFGSVIFTYAVHHIIWVLLNIIVIAIFAFNYITPQEKKSEIRIS